MLQIAIKVADVWQRLDVDDDSSLTLDYESPLFQKDALPVVHSREISVPATEHNSHILHAPEIYEQDTLSVPSLYTDALIFFDGILLRHCVAQLYPEADTERYTLVFYDKTTYEFGERLLNTFIYDPDTVVAKNDNTSFPTFMLNASSLANNPFRFTPVFFFAAYGDNIPPDLPTYTNIINRYPLLLAGNAAEDTPFIPFFHAVYILQKIFAESGVAISGSILLDDEFNRLLLWNNRVLYEAYPSHPATTVTIKPSSHVPDMNVNDFLSAMNSVFNTVYIPHHTGANIRIFTKDEILAQTDVTDISDQIIARERPRLLYSVDWTRTPYNVQYRYFERTTPNPDGVTLQVFDTIWDYLTAGQLAPAYIRALNVWIGQDTFSRDLLYPIISDDDYEVATLPFTPMPSMPWYPENTVPRMMIDWDSINDPYYKQDNEHTSDLFGFFWRDLQPVIQPGIGTVNIPHGNYHNIDNSGNPFPGTPYSLAFQAPNSVYNYFHHRWGAFVTAQKTVVKTWLVNTEALTDPDLFVRKYRFWTGRTYADALLKSLSVTITPTRILPAEAHFAIISPIPAGCETYTNLQYDNTFTNNITPIIFSGLLISMATSPAGWFRFNNAPGEGRLMLTAPSGYIITAIKIRIAVLGVNVASGHPTKLEHLEVQIGGVQYVLQPSQLSDNFTTYSVTTAPTNYLGSGVIVPTGCVINDQPATLVPFVLTLNGLIAPNIEFIIRKSLLEANGVTAFIDSVTLCPTAGMSYGTGGGNTNNGGGTNNNLPVIVISQTQSVCTAAGLADLTIYFSVTPTQNSIVISAAGQSATLPGTATSHTFTNVQSIGNTVQVVIQSGGQTLIQNVSMPVCNVPICPCLFINVSNTPATIGQCNGTMTFELSSCVLPAVVEIIKQLPGPDLMIYPTFNPAAGCSAPVVTITGGGTNYFVTGISAGSYEIRVTDANGCIDWQGVIVYEI